MSKSVVHLTGMAGRSAMGICSVVWGLCRAQLDQGDLAQVWCCDYMDAIESAMEFGVRRENVVGFPIVGPRRLCFSPRMIEAAAQERNCRPILHQHGIWTAVSRATNEWRSKERPTVLAPHGSLEEWALKKSRARKAVALRWFEGRNLRETTCLHATSEAEIDDFRKFGLRGPIALIPNGVSDDWLASTGDADRFRTRLAISNDKRLMLFLSRITPKKGLPVLISAWAAQRERLQDWRLIIAGVDEFGHRDELIAQIEVAGIQDSILFMGPMFGSEKRDAFAAAEVFVLPSHSEGSPMAVLDALGAGIPVLTTQRTPWRELVRHDCGWWVPDDPDAIGDTLAQISQLSREDLILAGARGKDLVSRAHSWRAAAEKCSKLYDWLLGSGTKPEFVIH